MPTALVLSRQKLPVLDRDADPRRRDRARRLRALATPTAEPELILIGTGSEVSLCLEAAELLAADGVAVRVVSMPSTSRFTQQDEAYRDSVLPPAVKARISVEAGSTLGWVRWVGDEGERDRHRPLRRLGAGRRHRRALRADRRGGRRARPQLLGRGDS